jgi:ribosome-associated translation inhibitor RaiA
MKVQVNSDHHIAAQAGLTTHVETSVTAALERFREKVTRIEVHLADENGEKSGPADKRCTIEARLTGLNPIVVTDHADNLHQAIQHASIKLGKAVATAVERHQAQRHRGIVSAHADDPLLSSAFAAEPKSEGDNEIDAEIDLDTLVQSAHPAA